MKLSEPTPEQVAREIGLEVQDWKGRCMEVAHLCLAAGLVKGRPRYGVWRGKIAETGHFAGRHYSKHGWVEVEPAEEARDPLDLGVCETCEHIEEEHERSGFLRACEIPSCGCPDWEPKRARPAVVFDPTRWVFEDRPPYLYHRLDRERLYDVAGARFREERMGSCPIVAPPGFSRDPDQVLKGNGVVLEAIAFSAARYGCPLLKVRRNRLALPTFVLSWLANLPFHLWREEGEEVYRLLEQNGHGGLIPVDFKEVVLSDGWFGAEGLYRKRIEDVRAGRPWGQETVTVQTCGTASPPVRPKRRRKS